MVPARRSPTSVGVRSVAAAALALCLTATACGGSDGASGDDSDGSAAEETSATLAPTVTIAATGEPTAGGSLVYGLEAETDGWNPTKSRWAVSGTIVGLAIFDPLTAFDEAGRPQPYLAESVTPNGDFTEWTISLRPGITFQNGDPLTSEAVKLVLEGHAASPLTGPIVSPIERVEVRDELTAVVVMSTPWSAFPVVLTSQIGMVPAPAQLTDPSDGNVLRPIGTGPFAFDSWEPDNELKVERNEGYWREGMPYLDSVTFKPLPDALTRSQALDSGDIDISHFNSQAIITDFREKAADGEVQIIKDPTEPEELFLLLNNGKPPFDDIRARKAVAHSIDTERYLEVFGEGISEPATGPFPPSSPWYVESGWQGYDLDLAKEMVADYEAEKGPLVVEYLATNNPEDRDTLGLLEEMMGEAGIEVESRAVDQGSLILDAVGGNFEMAFWRQWSAPDPDGDYLWWHSSSARPIGQFSLNLGRVQDPEIDAALDAGRGTLDLAARQEAYGDLQRRFAELVPYVWIYHSDWTIVADNDIRDIPNGPLPDGQPSLPFGGTYSASHRLTQVWLET